MIIYTYLYENKKYRIYLQSLPEHLRRSLYEGDWDVFPDQVFAEWRRERHVIAPFAMPQDQWRRFYCLDWGYSDPYAIAKLAVSAYGKVIQYGELYGCLRGEVDKGTKEASFEVAKKAWADAVSEGVTDLVADPACWGKQDGYPAPVTAFQDAGFRCIKANHDRIPGLQVFHDFLKQDDENGLPMFQVFSTCPQTIRTLPSLLPDPHKPNDVDSDMEDHLYDAIRYGLMSRFVSKPQLYLNRAQTAGNAAVCGGAGNEPEYW